MGTASMFHDGSRQLQDRFDTRRLADRIDELLKHDTIEPHDAEFISARDMFFLATADPQGRPNVSYKGGARGFVHVVEEHTLAFPSTPVPNWKRSDWARDALAADDAALDPDARVV